MKYKIYVDMDGVLTDWDSRFKEYSGGKSADGYEEKDMWEIINRGGVKWWSDMKWLPDGKTLWKHLMATKPTILTKPSRDKSSITGKEIWLKKNLPGVEKIITQDKSQYAEPNAILIDDTEKNINGWEEAGGIGILHKNLNDTVMQLNKILGKDTAKTFKQFWSRNG